MTGVEGILWAEASAPGGVTGVLWAAEWTPGLARTPGLTWTCMRAGGTEGIGVTGTPRGDLGRSFPVGSRDLLLLCLLFLLL